MEYEYYYSGSRNGFFPISLKHLYEDSQEGWPSDATGITDEEYNYLFSKQGADDTVIMPDNNGRPILKSIERPQPTAEDQRSELVKEADAIIQPLMGYALAGIMSNADRTRFNAWNEYRKALENLDTSIPTEGWPQKPI